MKVLAILFNGKANYSLLSLNQTFKQILGKFQQYIKGKLLLIMPKMFQQKKKIKFLD